MKYRYSIPVFLLFIFLAVQCEKEPTTLFTLKDPADTGIDFINRVEETDSFNILSYEYIYNGGGVGVADFNNDGLQDIFFTGNQVGNSLYLNEGDFHFKNVTQDANVNIAGRWNEGVAVVDINNDGWMDVYVCATTDPDPEKRRNMLFVNQGTDSQGKLRFKEMAADYKIDYNGHSVMAAFFDYDRDGDLDLYVLVNQKLLNAPTNYRARISDGTAANNDKLFRNNGNGTFSDVTLEAGIVHEGFGLGLAITDVNLDGWPDIYVSNDYISNDILYINSRNGTFADMSSRSLGHQSQFSMGNDAADINNDGLPDIITLDMLPETNARKKTTIGNKSYSTYINNEKFGYEYQYVRNMVHLNNGFDKGIKFSEVGQLTGLYQTEWSWSPLFADFDNDGNKDAVITNGFPKDITDKDFANYRADVGNIASNRMLIDSIPVIKIPNYAFKNNGDLTFSDVTKTWGMEAPSFSNGAAFADLDNDGDLDYIVNNINDMAFVYENNLYHFGEEKATNKPNFLRIRLKGSKSNAGALGTKITLYYDSGRMQYYEQTIYRGFLSSVEDIPHFGLKDNSTVDSIRIQWPDGSVALLNDVKANQVLTVTYKEGDGKPATPVSSGEQEKLFVPVAVKRKLVYKHEEEDKIDFNLQRTLPHKFSQAGPAISIGDINNDGLEDIIIGGSEGHNASIYKQQADGSFGPPSNSVADGRKKTEDEGLLLFDADADGDLDLYVVSGSVEHPEPEFYQDRLYINDGKGDLLLNIAALPETKASGSCVRAADFDKDGDLDLFVGGRVVPGAYPTPAASYVLRNDGGKFADITTEVCAEFQSLGLVTDALWTDFDRDGDQDLAITGEFMPITFFTNTAGKFTRLANTGLEAFTGWWNSITGGDFDRDGDMDYIAGNLGLNNNFQVRPGMPLKVFAKDFDGNGSIDPVLACYQRESMNSDVRKLYPMHFWDEINSQSPKFRNKYSRYRQYSKVTLEQVLTPDDLKGALILEATEMASSYIKNLGNGKFSLHALPVAAQVAPVNGMVTTDANSDGNLDVVLVGNDYGNEVFAGRYDAFTGMVLAGDGAGSFRVIPSAKSGFYTAGDCKALVKLYDAKGEALFIASQNKDSLQVFQKLPVGAVAVLDVKAMECAADVTFEDGKKMRIELYYGSGYLSQSSRKIEIPKNAKEITIYDYKGASRKVTIPQKGQVIHGR